jgi:hypothetical protein
MRKGNNPEPDPNLWLTDPDADQGDPKTYGSGTLSGRKKINFKLSSWTLFLEDQWAFSRSW